MNKGGIIIVAFVGVCLVVGISVYMWEKTSVTKPNKEVFTFVANQTKIIEMIKGCDGLVLHQNNEPTLCMTWKNIYDLGKKSGAREMNDT